MLSKLHFFFFLYFYLILSRVILLGKEKVSKQKNTILYFSAFFPENAGYHWRVKKWAEELEKEGYTVDIVCAVNKEEFYGLLKENHTKFLRLYLKRRFWQVVNSRKYETVIVRRELLLYNDYGNLFLEKLLLKIHPNAILDFDDDISAAKNQPRKVTNLYGRLLQEHGNKFNESLRIYQRFIVVSDYLKNKVLFENKSISQGDVLVIPTCVDYDQYPAKDYSKKSEILTFGWIGGDHNYPLLQNIIPLLNKLSEKYKFQLLVIGGNKFRADASFPIVNKKWSLETEIQNLYSIDVGLMPLNEDDAAKGKGGFKLIQYMGLGIVSVASGITINQEIVDDKVNSLLAYSDEDWESIFIKILTNQVDFQMMGGKAYEKVKENYTFNQNKEKYVDFIKA